jgi:hypothetical protein
LQKRIEEYTTLKMNNGFLISHTRRPENQINLKQFLKFLNNQSLGCDGGTDYRYLTLNHKGMEIFLKRLREDAEFTNKSMFLDVGSGRGNIVFCVGKELKPIMSYGIEGDECRYMV